MRKQLMVLALCFVVVALPVVGQQMFNSCVENEAQDCAVTLPSSFNTANSYLPDPFLKLDGTRMTAKEEWRCRRQEILKLAERTIYGAKPPKPSSVTGTVSQSRISVSVSEGGKTGSFSVTVTMPSGGKAPYPAVIIFGNSGAQASQFTSRGVATINYTPTTVGAESGGNRNNKSGVFYTIYGSNHKAGTLVAWAWGVSRIIDVIEDDPNKLLDPTAIGVTGCSRYGKGPFAAGALDQRIALTMPMESGTGGTNIMRGAYNDRDQSGGTNGAQSPSSAYGEQPWLGDDFSSFTNNPNNLPIDMHQVIGLIAPRGFFVIDKTAASAGNWLNIPSSHRSAIAGAEIYKALGAGGNMHYMNTPTTTHCSWDNSYNTHLQDFIDKFLLRNKAVGTAPIFTATAAPSMTNYMNWTAPALSGELTIGGCGPAPSGFVLSASASPSAGGNIVLDPPAAGRYEEGTTVTVTAQAAAGWAFAGWDGDLSGKTNPQTITMDANKSVTARFTPKPDTNGYFFHHTYEDRTAQGWAGRGAAAVTSTSAQKANGSRSLAVTGRTASWHGAQYTLEPSAFVSGGEYSFSAIAMHTGASQQSFKLTLTYTLDGKTAYQSLDSVSAAANQWVLLSNENAVIPAGASGIILYVEMPTSATADFFTDDAMGGAAGAKAPGNGGTMSARDRAVFVNKINRPMIFVRGRTLNIMSSADSELQIRVIDVRGKTAAKFIANGSANFLLDKIPSGRYFVDVGGAAVKQTVPIILK